MAANNKIYSKLRFVLIAILVSFGVLGCNTVKTSDFPGMWVVTDKSRQRLPTAFQNAAARIALDADGSFVVTEFPGEIMSGLPESRARLITGSGVWKLDLRDGQQQLTLRFRTIAGGSPGDVPYDTQLHISVPYISKAAPILFYYQGDPDRQRTIEFEKK